MTRAKSELILSGHRSEQPAANRLLEVLRQTHVDLREATQRRMETDREDIRRELRRRLGAVHADWIDDLLQRHAIDLSPLLDAAGKITHEPLFHFRTPLFHYICFAEAPADQQQEQLASEGYTMLFPGDRYDA